MYKGTIVSISKINPIVGKDVIGAAEMNELPGIQTVTSKDYPIGGKYVYFPPNVQLSKEFCDANDLCIRKDANGLKIGGGYFSDKRRVTAQKFGGVRSEGILFKLSAFSYLGESSMKKIEDMPYLSEFDFIGADEICRKYEVRERRKNGIEIFIEKVRRTPYVYILAPTMFRLYRKYVDLINYVKTLKDQFNVYKYNKNFQRHEDTEQLRYYVKTIPVGSEIIITEKIHGTSARTGYLPDTSLWGRVASLFGFSGYRLYVGTRNVVLKEGQDDPFYGEGEKFRWKIASKFWRNLEPGEDFSYEIAGFTKDKHMFDQKLGKIKKDYKSMKNFADPMIYSYGCSGFGHCEEFVYKYSKMINGKMVVQDWDKTKKRCLELGIKTVPELDRFIYDGDVEKLIDRCNSWLANDDFVPSSIDSSHLTEGICLRVNGDTWNVFKHKSFLFGVLEGYNKETATEEENN